MLHLVRSLFLLLTIASLPLPALAQVYAPDALGPFGVGLTRDQAVDPSRGDRTLPVQIWHPLAPGTTGPRGFYLLPPLVLVSENGILDPVPVPEPFPLIVFSHGSGGINIQSVQLCETLASHGFVVVAPEHVGNTTQDFQDGTSVPTSQSAVERPQDVSFIIDWMTAKSLDPADPFYRGVDASFVGVAGHSFGGYTALAMASGYAGTPPAVVLPDPRVVAIMPIAPASGFISDDEMRAIQVPTMLLSGTLDTTTPIDPNTTRPWNLIGPDYVRRADVVGATHTHFANICDIANVLFALGIGVADWPGIGAGQLVQPYFDTCVPPAFSLDEAQRIQDHYAVSFFRLHLFGEQEYRQFLLRDYALENEPNVIVFPERKACGFGFEIALALVPIAALRHRRAAKRARA
jgi:predicted dienelactone hydrolase